MIKSPLSSSNNRIGERSMDLSLVLKRSKFPVERTKGALQRLEVVRRASGLGSTIAVLFFPCGPYLCIVRAFGDLSVIKAWFVLVSCLTNFNGLLCSCFVINWG
ncbi:hypothetical protein NC653_034965 [Populus alba x Populus x berolinensis]|uniref:Uncharacterized protein n=1 Tax=Populus alba x Populus x berolinensis TaxID=444605 RepID=A0AAD6LNY3_9ROSI|nr:hypothetical protein NC653_034965 [Populus alba x Populus x berolinensis]